MGCMTREVLEWMRRGIVAPVLCLAAIASVPALRAADAGPGELAARLSLVDGKVSVSVAGEQIVDQALTNLPVSVGTELVTGSDGKAEIEFEDGGIARIAPNSALLVVALRGTGGEELVLEHGLGYFEARGGKATVRFGTSLADLAGQAVLRIRLDTSPGDVAVLSGAAHLELGRGVVTDLRGGESLTLNESNPEMYSLQETLPTDSWDAWNADCDKELVAEAAAQTGATAGLAKGNPAWGDLDANGSWYNVPGRGYVWSPYDASNADWEPYGCGSWVWTPRFGYVWVSCAQWGFMPYMCGGWDFYDGFGWGWAPGGCGIGWGGGFFTSIRVRRGPPGYRPIRPPHPGPRRPIGGPRPPHPPIISVDRKGAGNEPWPVRGREVSVGGLKLRPLSPRLGAPGTGNGPASTHIIAPGKEGDASQPAQSPKPVDAGKTIVAPLPMRPGYQPAGDGASQGKHGFWQNLIHSDPQKSDANLPQPGRGAGPAQSGQPRSNMRVSSPQRITQGGGSPQPNHAPASGGGRVSAPSSGGGHVSAPAPSGGGGGHVSAPSSGSSTPRK